MKIQARAIQRCGELIQEIPSGRGQQERNDDGTIREGTRPNGRVAAATAAGLSEHQRKQALRVANIPTEEFEEAVAAGGTVTELTQAMEAT